MLVITQKAYVDATQTFTNIRDGKWAKVTHWRGGKRPLTIVDETLCNIILNTGFLRNNDRASIRRPHFGCIIFSDFLMRAGIHVKSLLVVED